MLDRERSSIRNDSDQLEALLGTLRSRCPDDGRCVFSSGPEMAIDATTAARALSDTTALSSMINSSIPSTANGSTVSIEDQIRNVDKVLKTFVAA
ncbi:unnamed protein product [Gongylonema pulchrum]|uniref:Uncharacterized protein n=1 Tax=Gongylonema pulchrum TaxID=637853 RepID=A0A183EMU3_9BILA|nr:unnamed protein product [Gongylonema pulchrum]